MVTITIARCWRDFELRSYHINYLLSIMWHNLVPYLLFSNPHLTTFNLTDPISFNNPRRAEEKPPFLASSDAAPNLTLPQLRIEIINYYYYRYLHKKNMAFVAKGSSHKGRQSFWGKWKILRQFLNSEFSVNL